jgi:PAS domain-containing protein
MDNVFTSSIMSKQQDFVFLSKLMANANMGWWEANLATECYTCSEYISEILNLDETGTISFEDFNKRILNEEQGPTTVRSFDVQSMSEVVYLLKNQKGSVWMRSKICFREVDDKGNTIVYGIAEMQDGPDTAIACQALQRSERLLHNIYKNLPVGIELYNKEGVLVDLNDKELDLFHVDSKEELLGINIFENPVFPEEMKERLRNNEDADFTFRYDFSKLGEYYSNNKAEGTIDLVTKVTTLYDENHNPVNYLLINADKTETTVAYNKIQEFEEFFELIGDYAKVGYAHFNILSKQGHAQKSWYKNIGEEYGTPLSEIIGTYKSFHPDDRDLILQFFEEVQKGNADHACADRRLSGHFRTAGVQQKRLHFHTDVLFMGCPCRCFSGAVHVWSVQQEDHQAGSMDQLHSGNRSDTGAHVPVRLRLGSGTFQGCRKPAAESGFADQRRSHHHAALSDRGAGRQCPDKGQRSQARGTGLYLLCSSGKEGLIPQFSLSPNCNLFVMTKFLKNRQFSPMI